MSKNPFNPTSIPEPNFPRNKFDLSNNELFSLKFGQLMPVNCTEVIPGQTLKINSCSVGVRGMPTSFPIQTPIKGRLSWFYVRNRTLWKDFEDFIFKTKENLQSPWLKYWERESIRFRTGSLADALGLPTTKGDIGSDSALIFPNSYVLESLAALSNNGVFQSRGSSTSISQVSLKNLMTGVGSYTRQRYFADNGEAPSNSFVGFFSDFLNLL